MNLIGTILCISLPNLSINDIKIKVHGYMYIIDFEISYIVFNLLQI